MSRRRLFSVLERIADRLDSIDDALRDKASQQSVTDTRTAVVEMHDELREFRSHTMEQVNRTGEQVRRHETQITQANARLASLERERQTDGDGSNA